MYYSMPKATLIFIYVYKPNNVIQKIPSTNFSPDTWHCTYNFSFKGWTYSKWCGCFTIQILTYVLSYLHISLQYPIRFYFLGIQ